MGSCQILKKPNRNRLLDAIGWRIFAIARAIRQKTAVEKIAKATGIDPFFLYKLKNICDFEKSIKVSKQKAHGTPDTFDSRDALLLAKQLGFSDKRLTTLTGSTKDKIRQLRHKFDIHPFVKQIDTLAAEYPAETNYLYLTYNGESDDVVSQRSNVKGQMSKVIVLGSGPYRIGSSVEFDWCSVTCAQTAESCNFSTIIINCNPETVSTDFDMAQKLYFEELTAETVSEIYRKEDPNGLIVSMGGQTPNNLTPKVTKLNLKILGTSAHSIDRAEDRSKFSKLCDELDIAQPVWAKLKTVKEALTFAQKIGYPVLVRPSYVLSGAAMNVAFNPQDLEAYLLAASQVSAEYPVVISQFHQNSKEIEID